MSGDQLFLSRSPSGVRMEDRTRSAATRLGSGSMGRDENFSVASSVGLLVDFPLSVPVFSFFDPSAV